MSVFATGEAVEAWAAGFEILMKLSTEKARFLGSLFNATDRIMPSLLTIFTRKLLIKPIKKSHLRTSIIIQLLKLGLQLITLLLTPTLLLSPLPLFNIIKIILIPLQNPTLLKIVPLSNTLNLPTQFRS